VNGTLVVVDDVALAFADLVIDRSATERRFDLAFSGGSTAADCYKALASRSTEVDWSRVVAWWGDERCVPPSDQDSNFHLVDVALLDRVAPLTSVHPMFDGNRTPEDAAEDYERLLREAPPIDLVHLGLGPDGHTASLFPESPALSAPRGRLVVANVDPLGNNPHTRLTFTYVAIERARTVVVTVSGASKTEALHRVLDEDPTAPAANLRGRDIVWLVDPAALGDRSAR
jgi:6-phosphogluconolactonase